MTLGIGAGILACSLFPIGWLAAPEWEVFVVDEKGKPIEGVTVRETWYNYSVTRDSGAEDRKTDVAGSVTFPARRSKYTILRRIAPKASFFAQSAVASADGAHANAFAFGKCVEGTATIDGVSSDWAGSPSRVQSRVIARSAPARCSPIPASETNLPLSY
jgi:hypothetical protein